MAEIPTSLSKYERLVSYGATGVQAGALLAILVATVFGLVPEYQLAVNFIIAPLYILGLIYALLGLRPLSKRKPALALLLRRIERDGNIVDAGADRLLHVAKAKPRLRPARLDLPRQHAPMAARPEQAESIVHDPSLTIDPPQPPG